MVLADQITKKYFESILAKVGSINVIGEDFFRLSLVRNPGIAFGLKIGGQAVLSGISIVASIIIIIVISKLNNRNKLELWGYTFVLGGALGNLIDRMLYGKVVDFLDFDFPDFIMERWPVFNVADSFVSIGMVILLIYYLFFEKNDQKKSS